MHARLFRRARSAVLALALCSGCSMKSADDAKENQVVAGSAGASAGTPAAGSAGAQVGAGSSGLGGTAGTAPAAGASGTSAGTSAGAGASGTSAEAGDGGAGTSAGTSAGATGDAGVIDDGGDEEPTSGPFPPVTDFAADGPYTSRTLDNVGPSNNYVVYLPTELAPGGAKNPIVAWTSGGGTSHVAYPLLPRLATHGFVVISSNTIPSIGAEVMLGQEMIAGIEYLLAENDRSGSELQGKLDATKIAAMGYSMGSLATFTIASDPRLTTTVHISGGNMAPERVQSLRQPAAFICGVAGDASCSILSFECDIAGQNCATDFANATTPVFYAVFPSGHLGILTPPQSDAIGAMATAWLRYKLMGDTTLRSKFVGADCEYCQDTASWTVQQKNLN